MSHTMAPEEIESQASGSRLRDANGNPLQAGAQYMINLPMQWARHVQLFEDELTGDLCFRIDVDGAGPMVQRVDELSPDVLFFLHKRPGADNGEGI
jgi:hypothetical protein